jgi:hypothetical protein
MGDFQVTATTRGGSVADARPAVQKNGRMITATARYSRADFPLGTSLGRQGTLAEILRTSTFS